jgi:hypothetical protein
MSQATDKILQEQVKKVYRTFNKRMSLLETKMANLLSELKDKEENSRLKNLQNKLKNI